VTLLLCTKKGFVIKATAVSRTSQSSMFKITSIGSFELSVLSTCFIITYFINVGGTWRISLVSLKLKSVLPFCQTLLSTNKEYL
jgi:hypothetical protein